MIKLSMKAVSIFFVALFFSAWTSGTAIAGSSDKNLREFGLKYFSAWKATQEPDASAENVESYLSLLTDDIGHQHLPYDSDDSRSAEGKSNMRKGMTYYLGAHTEYEGKLKHITTGHNVIVIQYITKSKGIHPQTKQKVRSTHETTEVLEVEDGKVSVIRKYSE